MKAGDFGGRQRPWTLTGPTRVDRRRHVKPQQVALEKELSKYHKTNMKQKHHLEEAKSLGGTSELLCPPLQGMLQGQASLRERCA